MRWTVIRVDLFKSAYYAFKKDSKHIYKNYLYDNPF